MSDQDRVKSQEETEKRHTAPQEASFRPTEQDQEQAASVSHSNVVQTASNSASRGSSSVEQLSADQDQTKRVADSTLEEVQIIAGASQDLKVAAGMELDQAEGGAIAAKSEDSRTEKHDFVVEEKEAEGKEEVKDSEQQDFDAGEPDSNDGVLTSKRSGHAMEQTGIAGVSTDGYTQLGGLSAEEIVGRRIEVYWIAHEGQQNAWYAAQIISYNPRTQKHFILYDDGDRDWYDLHEVKVRLIGKNTEMRVDETDDLSITELEESIASATLALPLGQARRSAKNKLDEDNGWKSDEFLARFDAEVDASQVIIGTIDHVEVERIEGEVKKAMEAAAQKRKQEYLDRQAELEHRERLARAEVLRVSDERQERLAEIESSIAKAFARQERSLLTSFKRKERMLRQAVSRKNVELRPVLSALSRDGDYAARTVQALWTNIPFPVQVDVVRLRGIKDKLPEGLYSVQARLFDKIGGIPRVRSTAHLGAFPKTVTFKHGGGFADVETAFQQPLLVVCPNDLKNALSNVVVLEITHIESDLVVGWGALPLVSSRFKINEGHFKIPLLRGEVDPSIVKYGQFENRYIRDVENWLCNAYIRIKKLSRKGIDPTSGKPISEFEFDITKYLNLANNSIHPATSRTFKQLKDLARKEKQPEPIQPTSTGFSEVQPDKSPPEDELDKYTYAVEHRRQSWVNFALLKVLITVTPMDYVSRRSPQLGWLTRVLLFIIALWLRLYLHYLGQYVFLSFDHAIINDLRVFLWRCHIDYVLAQGSLLKDLAFLLVGPFTCLAFAVVFMLLSKLLFCVNDGYLSARLFCFLLSYIIVTVADPILVVVVDVISGAYAKAAGSETRRLVDAFTQLEGSGFQGFVLVILAYLYFMVVALAVLYVYLVYFHMHGRVHDLYRRLTLLHNEVYIPHDLELSLKELKHLVDYYSTDYSIQAERDYIAIGKKTQAGDQLLRHFHQLDSGAIVEVFGELKKVRKVKPARRRLFRKKKTTKVQPDSP